VFAVIHAGWRGALHGITEKTLRRLLAAVSGLNKVEKINAYIGPHIAAASFEVEARLAQDFQQIYGKGALLDETHVDLSAVITKQLMSLGMRKEAILDLGIDTTASTKHFFSYRAEGAQTGRFAAVAMRF
jgi:copper oxidase (laccase) domain-containing protein